MFAVSVAGPSSEDPRRQRQRASQAQARERTRPSRNPGPVPWDHAVSKKRNTGRDQSTARTRQVFLEPRLAGEYILLIETWFAGACYSHTSATSSRPRETLRETQTREDGTGTQVVGGCPPVGLTSHRPQTTDCPGLLAAVQTTLQGVAKEATGPSLDLLRRWGKWPV